MASDPLGVYLNDHLGGAEAGSDLAARCRSRHAGTALGAVLDDVSAEVDEDKATLVALMERLGVGRSAVKVAMGQVAERVSRVKLDERVTKSPDLSRLLELEALCLGIEGKRSLWRSLLTIADGHAALDRAELETLVARAQDQVDRLEPFRLEAAEAALSA